MNNSYITIIKEKRTVLSRKRVPLNQNECTADFGIGVPFEQNLQDKIVSVILYAYYSKTQVVFIFFCEILLKICYCSHTTVPRGVLAYSCQNPEIFIFFQWVKKLYNSRYSFSVSSKARTV